MLTVLFITLVVGAVIGLLLGYASHRLYFMIRCNRRKARNVYLRWCLEQEDGLDTLIKRLREIRYSRHGRNLIYGGFGVRMDRALQYFDPALVAKAAGAVLRWNDLQPGGNDYIYTSTADKMMNLHPDYAEFLCGLIGKRHRSVGQKLLAELKR